MPTSNQQLRPGDNLEPEQVILTARESLGFHEVIVKLQRDASGRFREVGMTPAAQEPRAARDLYARS